jgi:hypothetical protein
MWNDSGFDVPRSNKNIVVYTNKYVHYYNLYFPSSEYKIQSRI